MYYSDELYHHGIKGQRWGRRNGPPYPLSAQTHAAVVRSAGRGNAKKKGKVGRLPSDMEGYRRATSDEIYKTMNSRPTDAEAQETRRLYRERDRAAAKSFISIPTTTLGAGLTAAGVGARSIPMAAAGAGLTAAGIGAGIAGKKQMSKFRKDLDTAANANLKRRRISNMRSYNGVLYKKDTGRIGGIDDYDEDRSARRRKIARNIAIGAGLGAAALGTAYAIKKGRRSSLASGKASAMSDKANKLFGRARSLEGAGRGGALANRLTNQATRASGQARRYTNIASGYAKRRNIGIAAGALGLGTAGLGASSYIRDRRRRRKIGRR